MMDSVPVGAMVVTVALRRGTPSLKMLSSNSGKAPAYRGQLRAGAPAGVGNKLHQPSGQFDRLVGVVGDAADRAACLPSP